ncbi:MAG: BlaI/MecI/CopY family transcriptional regulator [Planctomycetota bacterium]
MARRRVEPLTPAEWKVMKIVWRLGKCAARDVYETAGADHGMGQSTTKTLLRRLVEKGQLDTTRIGNSFLYEPTRSRIAALCSAADRLLEHVDEGAGRVLAYMLKQSELSPEDVAELRSLLDELPNDEEEDDS